MNGKSHSIKANHRDLYVYLIVVHNKPDFYITVSEYFEELIGKLSNENDKLKFSELPETFEELKSSDFDLDQIK